VLLAHELQRQVELALQVVIGRAGHQHTARLAQLFQACGDVHTIAQQVVALDHHVAEVDPDPEHDPTLGRHLGLLRGDALLHRDGAGHGVDHRAELDDGTVTHELDEAALVLGQQRIDHLAAQRPDRSQRAGLVPLDERGVADHVGGHDCRQSPLRPGRRHGRPPRWGARTYGSSPRIPVQPP
jgi:hypothetical protein